MITPPEPGFTVICLPGAGRSRAVYRSWPQHLPAGARLLPLELPTYGYREGTPLRARVADVREQLHKAGHLDNDEPVGVFGHSFGATVAYELARTLRERRPHLFVCAARSPHAPSPQRDSNLDDDALVASLIRLSDASSPLLDHELREVLLPKIRADLRLEESYRAESVVMDFPVTVFGGTQDPLVRPADLSGWSTVTTQPLDIRILQGGHFLVDDQVATICQAIASVMRQSTSPAEGSPDASG
jgi:surfactin synthase thioesterase subunit